MLDIQIVALKAIGTVMLVLAALVAIGAILVAFSTPPYGLLVGLGGLAAALLIALMGVSSAAAGELLEMIQAMRYRLDDVERHVSRIAKVSESLERTIGDYGVPGAIMHMNENSKRTADAVETLAGSVKARKP